MYFNNGRSSSSSGSDYRPPRVPVAESYPASSYGNSTNPHPQQTSQFGFQNTNQRSQQSQWPAAQNQQSQNQFSAPSDPFAGLFGASTDYPSQPQPQPQQMTNSMMTMNSSIQQSSPAIQQQPMQRRQQQQQYQPTTGMNHMDPFAIPNRNNMNAMQSTHPDPFAPTPSTMNSLPSASASLFDPMGAPSTMASPSMQQQQQQQQQSFGQHRAPAPFAALPPPTPGQTPVINGMFLGLDTPKPAISAELDSQEEDKEWKQAQEAAMYAQELLRKQHEEKEKNKFSLGALAGKAQHFIQTQTNSLGPKSSAPSSIQNKTATTTSSNGKPMGGGFHNHDNGADISVDDVDYAGSDEEDERRPPWFAASPNPNHATTTNKEEPKTSTPETKASAAAAIGGAAALGGVAGLIALGPVVGFAAAGAMAVQAARGGDDGILRTAGRAVATVGGAAKRFEDKHGVGKKAASGLAKGVGWAVAAAAGSSKK